MISILCAVLLQQGAVTIEGEAKIDPARSTFITVKPRGVDLRERFAGFSVAEDFDDEKNGCTVWKLVPEPCAEEYKIRPFAHAGAVCGPLYFENPDPRESVTGGMEVSLRRDLPPLSWKLAGFCALALAAAAALGYGLFALLRGLARRVREHRMSPIERAWAELGRLLKKGLPGRGRYKDFYVELTMVVRRYIQRKYGIRAPHMTTEEFLRAARPDAKLREFLESADMV